MKQVTWRGWYNRIELRVMNKRKSFLIHRLVATTFIGNKNLVVDHIDNNKTNNKLSNLQFVSVKENISKYFLDKEFIKVWLKKLSNYSNLDSNEFIKIWLLIFRDKMI